MQTPPVPVPQVECPAGYRDATSGELDAVVAAAAAAVPALAALTTGQRADFLERIAGELLAAGPALIDTAERETSLPRGRLEGERGRTVNQLKLFAALVREGSWVDARIDPAQPERQPLPRADIRRVLQPIGPVAVFGASNFPLAFSVAGGDTASAFAAGNPVVVKGHPAHPATGEIAAAAIRRAVSAGGLPAGTFGFIHGAAPEVSLALVRHPAIAAVGFTGSMRAGRALFDAAAARPQPIPVFSEMSSINPVFVLAGALHNRSAALAEAVAASFTLGVGQFCTKPGVVCGVVSPEWNGFCAALGAKAVATPVGTMLTPGIAEAFGRGVASQQDVEWITRGPAYVARVTGRQFLARPELAHEVFGPYTLLVSASDQAELLQIARTLEGQLTATLHGTPEELGGADELIALLERKAGRLVFNGFPTGVEVCPAMHHGGPYPATTDPRFTSVGTAAILRFARPVCYQGFPDAQLPPALQNKNPLNLLRLVNGEPTRAPLAG